MQQEIQSNARWVWACMGPQTESEVDLAHYCITYGSGSPDGSHRLCGDLAILVYRRKRFFGELEI